MNKSRFAILAEEFTQSEPNKTKLHKSNELQQEKIFLHSNNNIFKHCYNEKRLSNSEYIRVKENESKMKKEQDRKKRDEEKIKSLSKENFPELGNTSENNIQNKKKSPSSFIHKLNIPVKTEKIQTETDSGWVKIMYDTNKCNIVMIFEEENKDTIEKSSLNEDVTHNTMLSLAELHKRRTEEYIELWGKEDWEKHFLFANNEYNYLDEDEDELIDTDCYLDNNEYLSDDLEI